VKFTDRELLINGRQISVPDDLVRCYAGFHGSKSFRFGAADYRVPEDALFVLSDNVSTGIDSRHIGAVPMRCVLGRVAI
jgi:hypothetical protein